MELRWAGPEDAELVVTALLGAVNWDPGRPALTREAMLRDAQLARYLVDFTDQRSFGVVAQDGAVAVGLAWAVCFGAEEPGYGFVSPDAPEVGLWVHPDHRRRGHGWALMSALVGEARRRGYRGLSLSVEAFNPAVGLYASLGFRTVGLGGESETMLLTLG